MIDPSVSGLAGIITAEKAAAAEMAKLAKELSAQEAHFAAATSRERIKRMQETQKQAKLLIEQEVEDAYKRKQILIKLENETKKQIDELRKTDSTKALDAQKIAHGQNTALSNARGGGKLGELMAQRSNVKALEARHKAETSDYGEASSETTKALDSARHEQKVTRASVLMAGASAASNVGAGLTKRIGEAVQDFQRFEEAMRKFQTATGANDAQMQQAAATAMQFGGSTRHSAIEVAGGMTAMAQAGLTADQALKALPGVMTAAAAGGMDVSQAIGLVRGTLDGFKLDASQAGMVTDVMAQAARVGGTSFEAMGTALGKAAGVSKVTAQSVTDIAGELAIFTSAGMSASKVGSFYEGAIAGLSKPSAAATNTIKQLGLSFKDTNGAMLPLTEVIAQVRDKTVGMSEAQREAAVASLFGKDATTQVLAVMQQSDAQMELTAGQVREFGGAAASTAAELSQGLAPAVVQAQNAIGTAGLAIGEGFAPAITMVAQLVQGATTFFGGLGPTAQAASVGVLGFAAAAGTLAGGLALIAPGLALLGAGPLLPVIAGIGAVTAVVAGGVVAYGALTSATQMARNAQGGIKDELAAKIALDSAQREKIQALAAAYDSLSGKTRLSTAESKRLSEVKSQLKQLVPGVAAHIDKSGNSHKAVSAAIKGHTGTLWSNTEALLANARARVVAAQAEADAASKAYSQAAIKRGDLQRNLEAEQKKGFFNWGGVGKAQAALQAHDAGQAALGEGADAASQRLQYAKNAQGRAERVANGTRRTVAPAEPDQPGEPRSARSRSGGFGGGSSGGSSGPDPNAALEAAYEKAKTNADRAAALEEAKGKRALDIQQNELAASTANIERYYKQGKISEVEYLAAKQWAEDQKIDLEAEGERMQLAIQERALNKKLGAAQKAGKQDDADGFKHELALNRESRTTLGTKTEARREAVATESKAQIGDAKSRQDEASALRALEIKKQQLDLEHQKAQYSKEGASAIEQETNALVENVKYAKDSADLAFRKAEAEAKALEGTAGGGEKAKQKREDANAAKEAADAAANAMEKVGKAEIGKKNTDSVRELQAALLDLASSPSLDKLVSTIGNLASKPEDLKRVFSVFQEGAKAGGDGWGGIQGGMSAVLGLMDPMSLAMKGLGAIAGMVVDAWQNAAQAGKVAADATKSAEMKTAVARAKLTNDPADKLRVAQLELQEEKEKAWAPIEERVKKGQTGIDSTQFWVQKNGVREFDAAAHDAAIEKWKTDEYERLNGEYFKLREQQIDQDDKTNRTAKYDASPEGIAERKTQDAADTDAKKRNRERLGLDDPEALLKGDLDQAQQALDAASDEQALIKEKGGTKWQEKEAEIQRLTAARDEAQRKIDERDIKLAAARAAAGLDDPTKVAQDEVERIKRDLAKESERQVDLNPEDPQQKVSQTRIDKLRTDLAAAEAKAETVAEDARKLQEAEDKKERRPEELETAYNQGLDRLNELDDELYKSERDDSGQKISIQRRMELDLAEAKQDHQEKLNDLLEEEADIRKDIEQLAVDEAAAVQAILDEGNAVRSKTEYEDKNERIQKVHEETEERRKELNEDLTENLDQQDKEKTAFAEATTRITALAEERIDALKEERRQIEANIQAIKDETGVTEDLNDARKQRERDKKTKDVAAYVEPPAKPTPVQPAPAQPAPVKPAPTQPAPVQPAYGTSGGGLFDPFSEWFKALAAPYFHTGGTVPGPRGADVPIIAQAGEHVYTARQHATNQMVWQWLDSIQRPATAAPPPGYAAAGGGGVSIGAITIHTQPGQDTRAIARQVVGEVESRMRRARVGW